jgi:hypothetical protein
VAEDERAAQWLPDDAVVVRSGEMKLRDYINAVLNHYRKYQEYALTVWCLPGLDAHEVAHELGTDYLPHGKFMETTVGRVRAAGFELMLSPKEQGYPEGHCDLFCEPSEEDWQRLRPLFGEPMTNPVRRGR